MTKTKRTVVYEHKIENGSYSTIDQIIQDNWESVQNGPIGKGVVITFRSKNNLIQYQKVLTFNRHTGLCTISKPRKKN